MTHTGNNANDIRAHEHDPFPREINPFNGCPPITYARRVEIYNDRLQKEVSRLVEERWDGNPEHYAIATSGSDGRFEKAPQSKMELVVLHDSSFNPANIDKTLLEFGLLRGDLFWEVNELKPLGDPEHPVSGYRGNKNSLYPTRMFDLQLLTGNPEIYLRALEQQEQEIFNGPLAEKCLNAMDNRRQNSMALMRTGVRNFKGTPVVHYDLSEGLSYYTGPHLADGGAGSFKFGPLRAVQYKLATDLIKAYIFSGKTRHEPPFTLDEIPNNIPERLLWLHDGGFTNRSVHEIAELLDHYCYFLRQYHKSQWNYRKKDNREMVTEFDKGQVLERIKEMDTLLKSPLIESK